MVQLVALALALLALGLFDAEVKYGTGTLLKTLAYVTADSLPSELLTNHSSGLINLVYRTCYCGICLLFMQAITRKAAVTKLAACLYLFLLTLVFVLYVFSDLLQVHPLRIVAFRIDTLTVSPMPVILLLGALQLSRKQLKPHH